MSLLENLNINDVPCISDYFKGKTIFMTGGSGFLGKALVEKLLYSCTGLEKIYLLMREKRGVSPQERLLKLYENSCFERLKKERPGVYESKVRIISGDITAEGLGLSEKDRNFLIKNTNVVFHVAASVKFDDSLKYSTKIIVYGTLQIVNLLKEMKKLSSFVHVSTAYTNTHVNPIKEIVYPGFVDYRELLEICDSVDPHVLEVFTAKYLGSLPNTYTFCKQLAENVVYDHRGVIPATIVRPSIVISSKDEPMPGWLDSFNGPAGFFSGIAKGILHNVLSTPEISLNYVPVDGCIKSIINSAWLRGTQKLAATDDIPVFNSCSDIKLTFPDMLAKGKTNDVTLNNSLWYFSVMFTNNFYLYRIRVLYQQVIPAILIDALLQMFGKKKMLLKIQKRVYRSNLAVSYYTTQHWVFETENCKRLLTNLKEDDKKFFSFDLSHLDIDDYFYWTCMGGRRYLLKEKDEDLPKSNAHMNRMYVVKVITDSMKYCLVAWFIVYYSLLKYLPY